jgi:uncharacterized protein (TIGR02444 family)
MTGLWEFTVDLYAHPAVQEHAHALQDAEGIDVNLLFFAAWCGMEHGVVLSAADFASIETQMAPWRQRVIEPLRALRRCLKTPEIANFERDQMAIRDGVKELELRAERHQLQELSKLVGMRDYIRAEPGAALALQNLEALLSYGAPECGERGTAALYAFGSIIKP